MSLSRIFVDISDFGVSQHGASNGESPFGSCHYHRLLHLYSPSRYQDSKLPQPNTCAQYHRWYFLQYVNAIHRSAVQSHVKCMVELLGNNASWYPSGSNNPKPCKHLPLLLVVSLSLHKSLGRLEVGLNHSEPSMASCSSQICTCAHHPACLHDVWLSIVALGAAATTSHVGIVQQHIGAYCNPQ